MAADARAQSAGASPFQPSLTDPRNVQRFKTRRPDDARDRGGDPAAVGRGRNRLRFHRRDRQEKESKEEARRAASAAATAAAVARAAAGRRRPHQRAADQGARALRRSLQAAGCAGAAAGAAVAGCLRAGRRARRQLPAEALDRDHARLQQQSHACSERQAFGLHDGRAGAEACNRIGRATSSAPNCAAATSSYRLAIVAERAAGRRQELHAHRRDARHQDQRRKPLFLSTDYPGSPNLPADIAKLPIFTTYGNTLGLTQDFNHLQLSAKASYDRTKYQDSKLTDGTTSSNHDRDFTQYGGAVRASYEVFPGVQAVRRGRRRHRASTICNSTATATSATPRRSRPRSARPSRLTRKLTGEVSVGYLTRHYQDPDPAGSARRGLRRRR